MSQTKDNIWESGRTFHLDLWYPRIEEEIESIEIGLVSVRASDSIQVSYDFDRDGWVVRQASTFDWDIDDKECNPDWKEVVFIQAWGRQNPRPTTL
jgi:hypothetical protein